MDSNELRRMTSNICQIFKEVTGKDLVSDKEETIVSYYLKRGWDLYDFRNVIENRFGDKKLKDFFLVPGNLNLRIMLNPSLSSLLEDIRSDLRHMKEIKEKKEQAKELITRPMILLKCGFRIPIGDIESYEAHNRECFENKGGCFFYV